MKVEKLIKEYRGKIRVKEEAIDIIIDAIRQARNGDTSTDIEDLKEEKLMAQRDRQLYYQFVKDLEDLTQ